MLKMKSVNLTPYTMSRSQRPNIILSGGGTGGHLFPALAIAQEIKHRYPDAEILFVGAKGKIEMDRVPKAGFPIVGMWISGLQRSLTFRNLLFPLKLASSMGLAMGLVLNKRPNIAVGTGGYASGPLLWAAGLLGIPTLVQEQNSYPGITNKWLGKKAKAVCTAYPEASSYFPKGIVHLTGNPLREGFGSATPPRMKGLETFGLEDKTTLFVTGGSLGARALNQFMEQNHRALLEAGVQIIWQTGKLYHEDLADRIKPQKGLVMLPFVDNMDFAYAAADVVLSRAGAGTISELLALGKAAVLVPSSNVAEDHQPKNARAVANGGAAICLPEADLSNGAEVGKKLLLNPHERQSMQEKAKQMARPKATEDIVDLIEQLASWKR